MHQRKGALRQIRSLWLFAALVGLTSTLFFIASATAVTAQIITPVNVSISPSGGTLGTAATTLTSVYRDDDGFADIRHCYLLVNDSLAQSNAAVLLYDRLANKVYLKNDAGTSWGIGHAPGTAVTLENSQCFVHVGSTTVSGSGSNLTVNWRIQLKELFSIKLLNAYMYVRDGGSLTDGWDKLGIYYNIKPEVVSIDPNGPLPSGTPFTINSLYRDVNGYQDIRRCYLLINRKFDQEDAVFLWYDKASNKVYLKDDTNTSWGIGYAPGTAVTLSNTQCEVNVADISVAGAGNDLVVTWALTLLPAITNKPLSSWMYVTDSKGAIDGWKKVGIHFVPIAPVSLFVSPSSGTVPTGSEQIFSTIYSDANGAIDISRVYFQLSVTSSQANTVLLLYDRNQNKVYLKNDLNNSWGAGFAPGTSVILENSQCTVNLDTMIEPNTVTDEQLEVFWPITLKASQTGKKLQIRMYVIDTQGLASGWSYNGLVTAL